MKRFFAALALLMALVAIVPAVAVAADRGTAVVVSPATSVRVGHGFIEISNSGSEAAGFQIYSITGQQVKAAAVPAGGSMRVELPAGYYIVKTPDFSRQVVVR